MNRASRTAVPGSEQLDRAVRRFLPLALVRNGWRPWHVVALVGLVVAAFVVTWDAWEDIYRIAGKDEESSHIFLVPPIAAWLVYVRRARMRLCRRWATWVGPAIILCGWAAHVLGEIYLWQSVWHFGAIAIVCGAALSVLGRDALVRFFPAFLVLLFLIPVPGVVRQGIAQPLQSVTAHLTHAVLETLGVAVDVSGNVLQINRVDVAIAEACNGLRMVFALVLVSFAFAFGTPLRQGARLLVLVASPVSAILCNVVRLVPTVWIYGNTNTDFAHRFHDVSGWFMLPIAFLILWCGLRLLRWAQIPVTRFVLAYGS